MRVRSWMVRAAREPMVLHERDESPGAGEVVVQVAGCGVCHTDLGFYYDGVPTRKGYPLTLGHEISGTVVAAGAGAEAWRGRQVVVPAVIPCGECPACKAGRDPVCPGQIFPGSDVHGGFATHVVVPARGLCPVPALDDRRLNPGGIALPELSVIADAVSTPYQAIRRSELAGGDLAVFVGLGGVGGFGVQLASAMGAAVVAIDVDEARTELMAQHGADLALVDRGDFKELRQAVRGFAKDRGIESWRHKIFETSGTPEGQSTAFGLVGHGGYLAVVGFTPRKVEIRLSSLMAFDATARGNWGCPPAHYPAILDMVLGGKVALGPFTERRPLASINEVFADVHERRVSRRVVLVPEA